MIKRLFILILTISFLANCSRQSKINTSDVIVYGGTSAGIICAIQLAMDGKMVIPTGNRAFQNLIVINKTSEGTIHTNHGGCAFVPLIGEEGWYES